MIHFTNDYSEGAHPAILEALLRTNLVQQTGYGTDEYSTQATALLQAQCADPAAEVCFVAGGTLANLIVLGAFLKPYESVIAAETGHIYVHEAGAIEATGHRIETVATPDGKLRPEAIAPLLQKFPRYHTVKPRIVYISNSTEVGTVYSKAELTALSEFCRAQHLLLYLDGARLPMALTAPSNDVTLADIARLTDVFYLGGTKCGALFGEAIVIPNKTLQEDFRYHVKQRGGLLAKGRVLGIQFLELLREGLLFELATHANTLARQLTQAIQALGYPLLAFSDTNQLFPILPHTVIAALQTEFNFYVWKKIDDERSAVRLITSWATPESAVDAFLAALQRHSVVIASE